MFVYALRVCDVHDLQYSTGACLFPPQYRIEPSTESTMDPRMSTVRPTPNGKSRMRREEPEDSFMLLV